MSIEHPEQNKPIEPKLEKKPEEEKASLENPERQPEEEISNEQIEKHVAKAETAVQKEAAEIVLKAEHQIESSAASMNVSPETLATTRQEQGLDSQLAGVQEEADQLNNELKHEIEKVMESEDSQGREEKPQVHPDEEGSKENVGYFARQRVDELAVKWIMLRAALKDREDRRFTSLLEVGGVGRISVAVDRMIEAALAGQKMKDDDMSSAIRSVHLAVKNAIDEAPRRGSTKDQLESLNRTAFAFKEFSDIANELARGIALDRTDSFPQSHAAARELSRYLIEVAKYVKRIARRLEEYERGY